MSVDILTRQKHPEHKHLATSFKFWRAANNGILDGGNPLPEEQDYDSQDEDLDIIQDTWLYRFPYETDRNYRRRVRLSQDFGFTAKVRSTYVGHAQRAEPVLKLDAFSDEEKNKLLNDTGSDGRDFASFNIKTWDELLGMGKAAVFTDANPETKLPSSFVIPREDLLDWSLNKNDGMYDFVIFRRKQSIIEGMKRITSEKYVGYSREEIIIVEKNARGKFEETTRMPNPIGVVPLAVASMDKPLIEAVAKFDVNLMNMDSVINQILRLQAVAVFYGPKGIKEQMKKGIGINLALEVPHNSQIAPAFASYPSHSLDGHFKYIDRIIDQVFRVSNTKHLTSNTASGISKEWDWLDPEAVLLKAAHEMELVMNRTLEFWKLWTDSTGDVKYSIPRTEFGVQEITKQLDDALKAIAVDMGKTANSGLRKGIRDTLRKKGRMKLTEEEIRLSDQEIDILEDFEDTMEGENGVREDGSIGKVPGTD